jgi:Asp-tRNA(Asn)/Glu-tRNA(Gln) amidotransferase A subunit family amidase
LLERLWREDGGAPFEKRPIETVPWEGRIPTTELDLVFLPAHRLGALIHAGGISSVDLTEIYLARLRRLDPLLLCAVTILDGRAREEAQQADADLRSGRWRGPLHGVPWGVKDLFAARGSPTTWGSEDFATQVIDEDAEVVVRLREAGAVLVAKLSTGELALGDTWFRGRTRNPWNVEEGASGSSAGPASATASACVAFSIGTETQGSIVSPSRRCGVSALRPTFGRVSRAGAMALAWSMDKPGPICRTIEDCALVFQAIHGSDERDPSTLTAPFRFERSPDLSAMRIGYTDDAPRSFVEKLRELGADPHPMPDLPAANESGLDVESAAAFEFHVGEAAPGTAPPGDRGASDGRDAGGDPARFTRGRVTLAYDYVQGQRRRLIVMRRMADAMRNVDLFVSGSGSVELTNQTGHPAVIVPYAFEPSEVGGRAQPQCTTLIGAPFADDKILSVANAFQVATEWHLRRPSVG